MGSVGDRTEVLRRIFFQARLRRIARRTGVVVHGGRAAYVARISCKASGRPSAGTAIWLHGGPFTAFDEELGASQAALLSVGYELIVPLYPGSSDREHNMIGDRIFPTLDVAIDEIRTAIGWARKRDRRILLVGDSFGAFLAAATSERVRRSDRLILFNPMLVPPRQGTPPSGTVPAGGTPEEAERFRQMSPEALHALGVRAYQGFMADWLDRDLIAILGEKPPRRMMIVYGDSDRRIGLERMPQLLALGGRRNPSLVLKDSDHEDLGTRAELDAFVALLRE